MSSTRYSAGIRTASPEPQTCWIRYAPRRWPTPQSPWVDLSRRRLGAWSEEEGLVGELADLAADDVVYFPPVREGLLSELESALELQSSRGVPVVCQVVASGWRPAVDAVTTVVDLLPVVLGLTAWSEVTAGTTAIWPLIPGGPGPESWPEEARRLSDLGFETVQAVTLELDPPDLRVLAGLVPEERGLQLFHSSAEGPASFAAAMLNADLRPYLQRPLPRPPLLGAGNLEAAGRLALAGEVSHLLGRPGRAGDLLRAARFAERLKQDLQAVVRDGHVGILPWASNEVTEILTEWAAGSEFGFLDGLYRDLLVNRSDGSSTENGKEP